MEKELRPANENPWYVLMTLHGEQEGEEIDWDLHERNKATWNAWALCKDGSLEERAKAQSISLEVAYERGRRWSTDQRTWSNRVSRQMGETDEVVMSMLDQASEINLHYLALNKTLCLDGFIFPLPIRISHCETADIQFHNALLVQWISVGDSLIRGRFDLSVADILSHVGLHESHFEGDLDLWEINAESDINLRQCTLSGCLNLSMAEIGKGLTLSKVKSSTQSHWSLEAAYVKIGGDLSVFSCDFRIALNLRGAKVEGSTRFEDSDIQGDCSMQDCEFNGDFEAHSVRFDCDTLFDRSRFLGRAIFDGSSFGLRAPSLISFTNAAFARQISFLRTRFCSHYPNFEGTALPERVSFEAKAEAWPDGKTVNPEDAKASCAVIRNALGKQGLPEAEHFFFRREMGFAAQVGGWWQRLPYRLFGALSDYGYSIQQPALWLLGSWGVFGMVIHLITQWAAFFPDGSKEAKALAESYHPFQAFALSFSNLFNFLGFQKTWFPAAFLDGLPALVRVLSALETIWGGGLFFLLLLGVRTRFRMR